MEFRLASLEDREIVENLWAYCFEPKNDPFFQWYFSRCYKPNNVLMGFIKEQMACLTHLNPYTIRLRGQNIATSYIVGLATHPAARRGGVGGKLLSAALEEMRRRGHYVNILMPSKAGFYQPYGYELYCHQWRETMSLDMLRPLSDRTVHYGMITTPDQWELLAAVYDVYTSKLSGYAVRDELSWRCHIEGQLAEGNIAVVFEGARPIGYLFYQLGDPTIHCGEFVYTSYKGKKGLLGYMYNHRSQGKEVQWNEGIQDQSYRLYPDGRTGHETMPFMAGRIVDVCGILSSISYPVDVQTEVQFSIEDTLASWNNGMFSLRVVNGKGKVVPIANAEVSMKMGIGALALLVFGAMSAAELVYYDKLSGSDASIRQLDKIFPACSCYINEWY
ncbi:GNAT family N-acetyltransferase [Megasphaera paucivorans]|uniref:Predicted acetyltransferase n=1 Tax=Megasphaera paucivorans TaxID=349095 RepID=A0A1G9XKM7_9FIRM|nr:GNAT family N-acetyltransferase [Megasphaera paucivorans]SDM97051.1 Predicted acetyltransferase [Megasphaera paucivorans]